MAPVTVDPGRVRAFHDLTELESWYRANHDAEPEMWLRIYKKASGRPTVTYAEAVDAALCWGWIDGIRKALDELSFLQRFTPRGRKSVWSQVNRDRVAQLIEAGRMTEHGLRHVEAARADGRWDRAYPAVSKIQTPPELMAAIEAEPLALETYRTLTAQNRVALAFRLHNLKTEVARRRRIEAFVEMLKRGETIYPQRKKT